jgi:hypothetical protein
MNSRTPYRFRRWFAAIGFLATGLALAPFIAAAPNGTPVTTPSMSEPPSGGGGSSGITGATSPEPIYDPRPAMSYPDSMLERDYRRDPPSRPWQLPVYFPPNPPTLGAPIPFSNPMLLASEKAPAALAEYVNEFFYAPLGTRLLDNRLSRHQQEKLQAYRAEKLALQKELRAKLAEVRLLPPDARADQLAAFARMQAPRLGALEKMAEEIRVDLVRGELFQSSVDWNMTRDWKLESSRFSSVDDALNAQYQVLRAAPFYQKGLLPEQRALLREIAMELREVGNRRHTEGEDIVNPPLFFSPATARLRLPAGLPPELSEKIAAYEREKASIKDELKTVLFAEDRVFFSGSRVKALETLADKQWPRIEALEDMAEDIRRDLARLPEPVGPPAPPPLPSALAARITSYLADRTAMQQDILAKIGQIKKDYAVQRVVSGKNSGGGGDLRLVINPGTQTEEKMASLRATLAAFNDEMSGRQKTMRAEEDAIRREFARAVPESMTQGRSIDTMLSDFAEALMQRDDWVHYDDYQTAMLTPGLSPEQRRLLFDAGVEKLALPLPGWDLTPVRVIQ